MDNKKVIGKIAMQLEPGKLEYQEYEVPEPEKGAVILKVTRSNVCGSEIHIWNGHHPIKKKGGLGHEVIGTIYKMGEGVTTDFSGNTLKIGDRIVAAYFITCRKCKPCLEGNFHLCEHAYDFWNLAPEVEPHFHATFSTHYYIHPNQYFYKVPDNVSDVSAASANCALSQVYFGLEKSGLTYNQTLVIQGAGGLGLNATALAKEKGANVIVIDGIKDRLEQAQEFGADHVIDMNKYKTLEERKARVYELTYGKGANVGLEVTGVPAAFSEGIHHIGLAGKYITMGNIMPGRTIDFDPGLLTRKSIQIIPVVRYDPWYLYKSLQFLSKSGHKYPFDKVLDAEFKLEETETALNKSVSREVTRASIVF